MQNLKEILVGIPMLFVAFQNVHIGDDIIPGVLTVRRVFVVIIRPYGSFIGRRSLGWIHSVDVEIKLPRRLMNIFLMLQVILLVLLFMFMADRVSKLVIEQFGSGGFHLTDDEGVFSH